MSAAVRTTCAYCGVGCGILATRTGERGLDIKGDPDHPANAGKLCSKGTHLGETVGLEGRLLHPMIGDKRASWDRALDLVAKRFRDTIAKHGPDSVAFYVSGQLLTEGLLCRQQADEGLHRLGQYRHQFKALHVERGRRSPTRVRRGYRAGQL